MGATVLMGTRAGPHQNPSQKMFAGTRIEGAINPATTGKNSCR